MTESPIQYQTEPIESHSNPLIERDYSGIITRMEVTIGDPERCDVAPKLVYRPCGADFERKEYGIFGLGQDWLDEDGLEVLIRFIDDIRQIHYIRKISDREQT